MELYLKRYYWVAILGCIASSSMLVAKTANTFVGTSLEPAPLLGLDQAVRPGGSATQLIAVDVERLGHLFGIEPPPPPADPGEALGADGKPIGLAGKGPKQSKDICYTCEPVKTGLRLQLLATMVSPDKHFSTAMISDLDKMESGLFRVGDSIKNADVYDIVRDPHRVIIANNDTHKLEYIDETPGSGATVVDGLRLPVSPVPPPGEGGGNMDGIRKLSDTSYEISRTKLDSTLADLNKVATQARIVPSFKNGQANGFKLFSIQPDSIYSAIGVQNGDVITSINGLDINSPEKALEAYSKLKDSSSFDITLDRRGSTVKMNYGVQ